MYSKRKERDSPHPGESSRTPVNPNAHSLSSSSSAGLRKQPGHHDPSVESHVPGPRTSWTQVASSVARATELHTIPCQVQSEFEFDVLPVSVAACASDVLSALVVLGFTNRVSPYVSRTYSPKRPGKPRSRATLVVWDLTGPRKVADLMCRVGGGGRLLRS